MHKVETWKDRPVISVSEFCEVFGISKSLGFKMVRQGEVPSIKLGEKRIVIPTAAVFEILKQNE